MGGSFPKRMSSIINSSAQQHIPRLCCGSSLPLFSISPSIVENTNIHLCFCNLTIQSMILNTVKRRRNARTNIFKQRASDCAKRRTTGRTEHLQAVWCGPCLVQLAQGDSPTFHDVLAQAPCLTVFDGGFEGVDYSAPAPTWLPASLAFLVESHLAVSSYETREWWIS